MSDAVVSAVVDQLIGIAREQIENEILLLRGVDRGLLSLSSELQNIRGVLEDAENRRFKDKNINRWLSKLEQTSYKMEDVLDEWNYTILKHKMEHQSKVSSFIPSSCLCCKKVGARHNIAIKIQDVKAKLDEILNEKDRYDFVRSQPNPDPPSESQQVQSTSVVDLAQIQGRKDDEDNLVSKLVSHDRSQEELGLQILSIVGVGGLGKTTLAQLVYNNGQVKESFDLKIWISVSNPFDEVGIAKRIIESVKESCPETDNLERLLNSVSDCVSRKKFLLVLDNVWIQNSARWEPLRNTLKLGETGSKILVTTRNKGDAIIMGTLEGDIHLLGQLSNVECWLLLRSIALSGRKDVGFERFKDIGMKIAEKCNGLPLAAKTLGSLLRFKNTMEDWENVWRSEMWEMKEVTVELFPHLLLSYNELSPALKHCFSYCAIFPKRYKIHVENLIRIWMALGYLGSTIKTVGEMEFQGRKYFDDLAMRSLFQDFEKDDLDEQIETFMMHDIVHDFAQFLRKNGRETAGMEEKTCQVCKPFLVSCVKDYGSLFFGCDEIPPNLCDCLTSLRALKAQSSRSPCIPQGMEKLIHLRWLDLSENKLSKEDIKTVCKLYNLQFLFLSSCYLEEVPSEIGNLIRLKHLDLSDNKALKELPESICSLHELWTLNLANCFSFCKLPQGIDGLKNLEHLHHENTRLYQFPENLAQLTDLRTLNEFRGGSGWSKLGWLKNLNRLRGSLTLVIRLSDGLVEDAREAELRNKTDIEAVEIRFEDEMDEKESSSMPMGVIDALTPHPELTKLAIQNYMGSNLPSWITSPLNQVKNIQLSCFDHLSSLPPLGKLPCLETICLSGMYGLQFVGREFLGMTRTGNMDIAFPQLKKLTFSSCYKWMEWEDISAEEEDSETVSVMPCLKTLTITNCISLRALPHRLLRKASSMEELNVFGSTQLQHYKEMDGSALKSISQNPTFRLRSYYCSAD